ncbi:T-cell surface glycoprotein CD3 zeta chain [Oryzias melastigma]|uniref:T-cell surface glycoprotein CD3 zeta chain n=1 Tax=Oryzias melastigma TaxID=30732 RepID=A0A834EX83_ORYME|nr:T-cell surface glycoprotein CD3 zeta chain [Oryzias melastigma]
MSTAALFSDPVICYFLDTFLMLYCLVATTLFFKEKFSTIQATEPNDETKGLYQELNLEREPDDYEMINIKKKRGKKKKAGQNRPPPREKDLYESLVPNAHPAPPAVQ